LEKKDRHLFKIKEVASLHFPKEECPLLFLALLFAKHKCGNDRGGKFFKIFLKYLLQLGKKWCKIGA